MGFVKTENQTLWTQAQEYSIAFARVRHTHEALQIQEPPHAYDRLWLIRYAQTFKSHRDHESLIMPESLS